MISGTITKRYPFRGEPEENTVLPVLNKFVKESYGQFVFVDVKSLQKEQQNVFSVNGGASFPYYVEEAGLEYPHLRYNVINEVLSIEIEIKRDRAVLVGISRSKFRNIIKKQEAARRRTFEYLLLNAAKDRFSQISFIQVQHNPLLEVLRQINNIVEKKTPIGSFEQSKWDRYIKLLENLDVLSVDDFGLNYGQMYKEFEARIMKKEKKGKQELVQAIFDYVLDTGSQYLTEYLHLTSTMPFLRSSTSYYSTSMEMQKLVPMYVHSLLETYSSLYGLKPKPYKFENWIDMLSDKKVGILQRKDGVISGDEEIFEKLERDNNTASFVSS